MKNTVFTGMATALVTPMKHDGSIDYEAFGRFVEFQIENGINALVVMGTTGENATIEYTEQKEIIRFVVERCAGRVPVIAGTGTNNTEHVISNTKAACNLLPKTAAKLAEHPNIVAIKEATGNMAQMVELRALCGDKLDIYSGEDALTVPMMAMGAKGTISVLSNVVPKESVAMTDACRAGDFETAAKLQCRLLPLINALFSEVNPIPAKAAAAAMGYGKDVLRLPLTSMEDHTKTVLLDEMRKLGMNV